MSIKAKKKRHIILIILAIVLAVVAAGTLILMTHTQSVVGMIQKLSANTPSLYTTNLLSNGAKPTDV